MPLLRGIAAPQPSPERPPPCRTVSRDDSRTDGRSKRISSTHSNSSTRSNRSTANQHQRHLHRTHRQLKGLAELKSQGILTDAEFDAQKARSWHRDCLPPDTSQRSLTEDPMGSAAPKRSRVAGRTACTDTATI